MDYLQEGNTMIQILSLLSFAKAEIVIQTNLKEHYIVGQPIFVDILIHNTGETSETLPNLEKQTWKLLWIIENQTGKQKIRSTQQESQEMWTLAPRQLKEVRFELPNSAELPTGKQKLELRIELGVPYSESKELHIHQKSSLWDDREIREEQAFFPQGEYLWGQAFSATQQIVFLESDRTIPLFTAPQESRFQQSISNYDHHIYTLQNNQLQLHSLSRNEISNTKNITLPWKDILLLARGITDFEQRLHLPLWIADPNKTSGTIRSIQVAQNGSVSYRKIITLAEKPVQVDSALTSTGTPLYLIQTKNRIYLLPLTQTGDPKIDALSPQSTRIRNVVAEEDIISSQFAIDSALGLVIHVLSQKEEQIVSEIYSLQGKEQSKKIISKPSEETNIKEVLYYQNQLHILSVTNSTWYQYSKDSWNTLDSSQYPIDQNIKLELVSSQKEQPSMYLAPKDNQ